MAKNFRGYFFAAHCTLKQYFYQDVFLYF